MNKTSNINPLYIILAIILVHFVDYIYFKFLHNWLKFPDYFPIMYLTIFFCLKYFIKKPFSKLTWIEIKNKKEIISNLKRWLIYWFYVTIIVLISLILSTEIKFDINVTYMKWMSYMFFGYLIFVPISAFYEELHYRWLYLMLWQSKTSKFLIAILASIIFSYLHIYILKNYSFYYPINIFLLAIIFSLLTIRKGNIIISTWFHISWNLMFILLSPLFNENSERYAEMSHITTIVLIVVIFYEIYNLYNEKRIIKLTKPYVHNTKTR